MGNHTHTPDWIRRQLNIIEFEQPNPSLSNWWSELVPTINIMAPPNGKLFYFEHQYINVTPVDPYLQYKIELIEKYKNN